MNRAVIEFQTVVEDNIIRLPEEYRGRFTAPERITIRESPDAFSAALDRVWAESAKREPLSEEDIEAEIQAARAQIRKRKNVSSVYESIMQGLNEAVEYQRGKINARMAWL